jgi:hypothetical protein
MLTDFIDYVCLAYHEARNVRHLIRSGHFEAGPFELVRSLPTNRDDAWRQLGPVRSTAASAGSSEGAVKAFSDKFGISLTDLVHLYENPHWRSSHYGGNAWAAITARIEDLRLALRDGEEVRAHDLCAAIPKMDHNTGNVAEKLRRLRATDGRTENRI